jgi:hypothetical protein
LEVTHDLVLKCRLAIGEFLDRLGQWYFIELLFQLLRDDYGKDVDGANWDFLDAGSRTGSGSRRGGSNYGWRSGHLSGGRICRFGRRIWF